MHMFDISFLVNLFLPSIFFFPFAAISFDCDTCPPPPHGVKFRLS